MPTFVLILFLLHVLLSFSVSIPHICTSVKIGTVFILESYRKYSVYSFCQVLCSNLDKKNYRLKVSQSRYYGKLIHSCTHTGKYTHFFHSVCLFVIYTFFHTKAKKILSCFTENFSSSQIKFYLVWIRNDFNTKRNSFY